MTKRKDRIIFYIWLFLAAASRILFYLFDYTGVLDTYGFYDSAMIRLEEGEKVLSSGLGFAYTNAASRLLGLFGNNIITIFIWQLVLEVIAFSLIFWGARIIWGMPATMAMMTLLTFSPAMLLSVKTCSPEQFFMIHFSIIFFLMALFYRHTRLHGWFKSSVEEGVVVFIGIYTGVLLAWNYMGFFALIIMIYVVVNNHRINDDKNKILILTEEELEEKDQMMRWTGQIFLIIAGAALGMFFTLMKYTGYTGYTIVGQFIWWKNLFKGLPHRAMDFSSDYAITFLLAFVLCLFVNIAYLFVESKKEIERQAMLEEERLKDLAGEDNAFTQKRILGKDYFITEDGREVEYLQNPLPIPPKKHDRVSPKFDIDQIAKENASAIINGDKIVERLSDGMVKAGMGIENIVKLKEITTGGSFGSGKTGKDKMIDPLSSDKSFEPIIDVLNLDSRDDFDIDIADGDDFDI